MCEGYCTKYDAYILLLMFTSNDNPIEKIEVAMVIFLRNT